MPVPADPTVLHPMPEQPRVVLLKPARLIRTRYSDEDVARLLAVAWWDWSPEHITEHVRTIMSGSVDDLEAAAG